MCFFVFSCSLNCWKTHSAQDCQPLKVSSPLKESTLENYMYRTEDTVPPEKLELLGKLFSNHLDN